MVVPKKRLPAATALREPEELCIERVRQLTCPTRRVDRVRGPVQDGTMGEDEVIPGLLITGGTGTRERQVLEMEPTEISLRIASAWRAS
jgi:hypothetical protein